MACGRCVCDFVFVNHYCGVVQNQRSLQPGEEAWLLAWQYQPLAARINQSEHSELLQWAGQAEGRKVPHL